VGEFVAEVFAVFFGGEVAAGEAPVGDGVDNTVHQIGDAGFALRRDLWELAAGDFRIG